jgi:hypothetical protein
MRGLVRVVLVLCCIGAVSSLLAAQGGSDVLTGTVEDDSQASFPGVTVVAANTQTRVQTTVISNKSGSYNIPNLRGEKL